MTKHIDSDEVYALLYGLIAKLSELPYEYYPHDIGYELQELCEVFAPQPAGPYRIAFREGLLKWQATNIDEQLQKAKELYPDQIQQYKDGNTKVLGFLIGMLVKEGCDPIEARDAWIKELQ